MIKLDFNIFWNRKTFQNGIGSLLTNTTVNAERVNM